jgi:hypothetical protein
MKLETYPAKPDFRHENVRGCPENVASRSDNDMEGSGGSNKKPACKRHVAVQRKQEGFPFGMVVAQGNVKIQVGNMVNKYAGDFRDASL